MIVVDDVIEYKKEYESIMRKIGILRHLNISSLLQEFVGILSNPDIPRSSDRFFQEYGVGNIVYSIDQPYERLKAYELLLKILNEHSASTYKVIHKGTPYFVMSWIAFQIEDFQRGVYYADCAINEDIRKSDPCNLNSFIGNPSAYFFLLKKNENLVAKETLDKLIFSFEAEISITCLGATISFSKDDLVEKFLVNSNLLIDKNFRTIITSLYSFVLEHNSLSKRLKLRGINGSTIEPFLLHLFKGGVLLESILKLKTEDRENPNIKLKTLLEDKKNDLNITKPIIGGIKFDQVVTNLQKYLTTGETYNNRCFLTAYGVRNTTGHFLGWSDLFDKYTNAYDDLYKSVIGAILLTIYYLWIK